MRLIDADELKKALKENACEATYYPTERTLSIIDNAPTVELFCSYLSDGEVRQPCVEAPCKHERPTGEWIKFPTNHSMIQCSQCTAFLRSDVFMDKVGNMNFCPNCGAKMKGAEE